MSINMDDMGVDYSDFEYQQFQFQTLYEGAGADTTNPNIKAQFGVEPLEGQGGLDVNEVAELVYHKLTFGVEIEDESGDQDVATTGEMRGVFGANLPASNDLFISNGPSIEGQLIQAAGNTSEDNARLIGKNQSEDRVFDEYKQTTGFPADDATNGPGSNGATGFRSTDRNWRDVTGRGPVLDSSDDLNLLMSINASDTTINFIGECRVTCVWDTAEVDDAGRAFSVPK